MLVRTSRSKLFKERGRHERRNEQPVCERSEHKQSKSKRQQRTAAARPAGIWSIRAKSTIARPAAERQSQQFGQFRQSISERTADPTLLRRSIRQPKPEPEWLLLRELHHRPTVRTARRTAEQPTRNRQLAADQPVQTCGGMAAEEGEERDPRHLRNTWHRRHHPRPGTTDLARCHAEGRRDCTRRILRGFRRGPHCDRNRGTRASGRMARA